MHKLVIIKILRPLLIFAGVFSVLGCSSHKPYTVRPSYIEKYGKTVVHNQPTNNNRVKPKKTATKSYNEKPTTSSKKNSSKNGYATGGSAPIPTLQLKKKVAPYIGTRYRYGGTSKSGIDCSGLVYRVFNDLGYVGFSRTTSHELYKMGKSVSRKNARAGDLVFFKINGKLGHVAIYMGNGVFAHASSSKGVMYSNLSNSYWKKRLLGFRRI